MASLIDRIDHTIEPDTENDEDRNLNLHLFSAALRQWALGKVTRTKVVNMFDISSGQEAQLDAFKTEYDAKTNDVQRINYLQTMIDAMIFKEKGRLTHAQFKTMLDLPA